MGKIIKETKYLRFEIEAEKPKTKVIGIYSKSSGNRLGFIEWYSPWRQYIFEAEYAIIWNYTCLQDVVSVINQLMAERKK